MCTLPPRALVSTGHRWPPLDVERTDGGIRVLLGGDAGPTEVRLTEELTEPLLSQCSAQVTGAVRVFTLASITQE